MVVQVGEEVAVLLKALCKPKPVIAFERLHLRGHYRFDLAHAPSSYPRLPLALDDNRNR